MKQISTVIVAAICLALGGMLLRSCGYRAGAADALARAHDDSTNMRLARFAAEQLQEEAAWRRTRDSLDRANAAAKRRADSLAHRADSLEFAIVHTTGDSVSKADAVTALAAKDTTIAAKNAVIAKDSAGIHERDRHIVTLEAQLAQYRDVEIPGLQRDRDAWKKKALRPLGCTIGPSGTAGMAGAGIFAQSTVGWGASVGLGVTCGLRLK